MYHLLSLVENLPGHWFSNFRHKIGKNKLGRTIYIFTGFMHIFNKMNHNIRTFDPKANFVSPTFHKMSHRIMACHLLEIAMISKNIISAWRLLRHHIVFILYQWLLTHEIRSSTNIYVHNLLTMWHPPTSRLCWLQNQKIFLQGTRHFEN